MGNRLVDELLMSPVNHNTLIAATDDGIDKSNNAGGSWVKKFDRAHFTDMDFKPGSNGRVIYACTADSIYRSDDSGSNWSVVTSGFYIPGGAGGQGLRIRCHTCGQQHCLSGYGGKQRLSFQIK
jgi:hypothetical protein